MKKLIFLFLIISIVAVFALGPIDERRAFYDNLENELREQQNQEMAQRAANILKLKEAMKTLEAKIKTPQELILREQEVALLAQKLQDFANLEKIKALEELRQHTQNVDNGMKLLQQAKNDLAKLYAANTALPNLLETLKKQVYEHIHQMNMKDIDFDQKLRAIHEKRNQELAALMGKQPQTTNPVQIQLPAPAVQTQQLDTIQEEQPPTLPPGFVVVPVDVPFQEKQKVKQKDELGVLLDELNALKEQQKEEERQVLDQLDRLPKHKKFAANKDLLKMVHKLHAFHKRVTGDEGLEAQMDYYASLLKHPKKVKQKLKPVMKRIYVMAQKIEKKAKKNIMIPYVTYKKNKNGRMVRMKDYKKFQV